MLVYGKYECFLMQMLYVNVHPVTVLDAAFCMTHHCHHEQCTQERFAMVLHSNLTNA